MKLLVGLGNPGNKYEKTRHNIGFRFLDLLAKHEGLRFDAAPRFHAESATWETSAGRILLVKPQTFMNHSGDAVAALARYYQVDEQDIFVVYDDLDLPSGKLRIKKGGGHGGHNGLRSINTHLPTADYVRIKIGIGRPVHGDVSAWVLGKADEGDRADENRVLAALLDETGRLLSGETDKAANRIHLTLQES
ncbi:peptidyl-tRNA hydrolase, PTH1 family [Mariprofundus micogutta]|uniref:Peptidyl-tRNA hydrolase n=1 Tax=Mariprofundus micogutta TaxID=1921010 RepID=A0A1L8CLI2_9PROT|nr:aminoacyl-tRNA hydrolase [Mariprofundus micogutta]GAV19699.1 peptidyl-tRNA hydrolase, PTH1 family [Mariprofundus micogutta]